MARHTKDERKAAHRKLDHGSPQMQRVTYAHPRATAFHGRVWYRKHVELVRLELRVPELCRDIVTVFWSVSANQLCVEPQRLLVRVEVRRENLRQN